MLNLDHLVYGVRDLEEGMAELDRRLGVLAARGGKHAGRGTHNALIGLGGRTYLEIIAFDGEAGPLVRPPLFALDRFALPRLVGFAVGVEDIEAVAESARRRGYDPGPVEAMARVRSDGTALRWRLTPPPAPPLGVVPFLIDWGDSSHPGETSPQGPRLVELRAEHPEPAVVRRALAALGVDLRVDAGPEVALVATLESERGRTVL
ncbi:MAG TPA: VOC family protein [Anaeromyxobacteraceae bacterium]|nr:VOC family protein [Anaeromyxobacteraceae bacterium]